MSKMSQNVKKNAKNNEKKSNIFKREKNPSKMWKKR